MKTKPKHIKEKDWQSVDSPALNDELLNKMRPVKESHPEIPHRVRGPQKDPKKVLVSVRYSPEVIKYFKSTGPGWQSRMDNVLREYVESHQ